MKRIITPMKGDCLNVGIVEYKHTRGDKYTVHMAYDEDGEEIGRRRFYEEEFPGDYGTIVKIQQDKEAYFTTKPFELAPSGRKEV